jgi:phospholipase/carboxylesterase
MPTAQRTRIAALDCIVVDGGPSPSIAVVICHGYGASYEDLAPLAGEWIGYLHAKARKFRFVFPDAPHTLADLGMPESRAWWPIDMMAFALAVQTGRFDDLHEHQPPGLNEARELLCGTIHDVKRKLGGESTPLVLGGFSQGAMLAMDVSLRGDIAPPQLLFQFSGTILCRPQWQSALERLAATPVYQSHGSLDPILPFSSAVELHQMLQDAGVPADFHSFVGPHTIDYESIGRTARALDELASLRN